MQDKKQIQNYINNFRRHISAFLKPGIGLACKAHPVQNEGAVLEFFIGRDIANDDEFFPVEKSVNAVLNVVPQKMIGGDLNGVKFGGTNISMEENRIVLIKGEDQDSQWNNEGARRDVEQIVRPYQKENK